MTDLTNQYRYAKERYAQVGVDTDKAMETLAGIKISLQCWQGDDVKGFLFRDEALSGGIQATGNYPGAARTPDELKRDIGKALSLIPGKHKVSLHAIYADTAEKTDLDGIEPRHYSSWVDWAAENGLGLDFNPTCFSHPMAKSGMTVSSPDAAVRDFWVEHCKRSRRVAAYFGEKLGQTCVTNFWFPDGYKDTPADRYSPRQRMAESLDRIFSEKIDPALDTDALESKLFGIGAESYTSGSNEFCLGYAISRGKAVCLDSGHFHPTEYISDKISSVLMFVPSLLLHVSRPVRWDSDHVVTLDDELYRIADALISHGLINKTHIGLDYFDASINRIAAWVIGVRNTQKALLYALLSPRALLEKAEAEGDFTARLAIQEDMKSYPSQAVWEMFLERMSTPRDWLAEVRKYENEVLSER